MTYQTLGTKLLPVSPVNMPGVGAGRNTSPTFHLRLGKVPSELIWKRHTIVRLP